MYEPTVFTPFASTRDRSVFFKAVTALESKAMV
jgi:hypothetical protein